jgi:hypothetical protein
MKKTLFLLAGIIIGSLVLEGCKKGPNDPFITLSSRRARLSGDWKMTKLEVTQTSTDASGTDTYVYTGDGSTLTASMNGVASPAFAYTLSLNLDKKGAFTQTNTDASSGTAKTYITSGQWFFAGKNKELELKKREAIIFDILSSTDPTGTDTYTGVAADDIYVIDQLKSKEMIVVSESTAKYADGSSSTTKSSMTFTQ